jgi:hypothetical protein
MWFFGGEFGDRKADAWMYQVPPPPPPPPASGLPPTQPTAAPAGAPIFVQTPLQAPNLPPFFSPLGGSVICLPPQPPNSVCFDGVWIVNASIVVTDRSPITISNPIRVIGNFTISGNNATVAISITSSATTAVTIDGCVTFSGTLNVSIDSTVSLPPGAVSIPIASFQGYCGGQPTQFTSVSTNTGCRKVTSTEATYTDRSLVLLLNGVDDSGCRAPAEGANSGLSTPIIGGIAAAAAVVVVGLIIGLVFLFRRKLIPSYRTSASLRKMRGSTR